MKVVYVIGVFDLFHTGHVELLRRAKALGDKLVVAINGDKIVEQYKRSPFVHEKDRLKVIEACRYVDKAFIIRTFDNRRAVLKHHVNIIVHGNDWVGESYLEQIRLTPSFIARHHIELKYLPYTKGISTSGLIQKIKNS